MPAHTPNRALNRHQLETIAWQVTPDSERRGSGSRREVLVKTADGMTRMPLADMTDNQIRRYIGPQALEQGGDMRHNGGGVEAFKQRLEAAVDLGDRKPLQFREGAYGRLFVNFYNVPEGERDGAARENNRIMLDIVGLESEAGKIKVELAVRGPSFGDSYKLRAKTTSVAAAVSYCAEYINRCAQKKPYGFAYDNYEKNASRPTRDRKQLEAILWKTTHEDFRGSTNGERTVLGIGPHGGSTLVFLSEMSENQLIEKISQTRRGREALIEKGYAPLPERHSPNASRSEPNETAARELSLYIENDYSLVGAPNSQGKQIEKNLLRKIQNGSFDLEKSELAWMYLMETGAKQYSKEFGGTWSVSFNKATRELVAHEFATTFYADNKGPR